MDTPPDGTRLFFRAQQSGALVAIIDDEPIQRLAVRRQLHRDFSVHGYESLKAALESGDIFRFAAILLDVRLGSESGITACRRLRRMGFAGGISMLSGLHDSDTKARALDAGADDYITRPVEGVELRARLRSMLRRATPAPMPAVKPVALPSLQALLEELTAPNHRRLLRLLEAAKGRAVKRHTLKSLGLENPAATDKALEKTIERMREILEPLGVRIETVPRTGYSCPFFAD